MERKGGCVLRQEESADDVGVRRKIEERKKDGGGQKAHGTVQMGAHEQVNQTCMNERRMKGRVRREKAY